MVCYTYLLLLTVAVTAYGQQAIRGTQCSPNQVITKLTFYEDGAIEAECNKLPCGYTGPKCTENQASCKAESDVLSGMKWAPNGQSVLLRCCQMSAPTRLYVGTDRVTLGSYYTGGIVEEKDLYGKNGDIEFDFISNMRTEQGAVRIWVYRAMCSKAAGHIPTEEHGQMQLDSQSSNLKNSNVVSADDFPQRVAPSSPKPFNPLRYTPANYQAIRKPTNPLGPVERIL